MVGLQGLQDVEEFMRSLCISLLGCRIIEDQISVHVLVGLESFIIFFLSSSWLDNLYRM